MDFLGHSAFELQSMLRPIVDLIVKEIHPTKDEISLNEARSKYPRRWVDSQLERGNLKRVHRGNRWVVSSADLACLWAAEHEPARIIFK